MVSPLIFFLICIFCGVFLKRIEIGSPISIADIITICLYLFSIKRFRYLCLEHHFFSCKNHCFGFHIHIIYIIPNMFQNTSRFFREHIECDIFRLIQNDISSTFFNLLVWIHIFVSLSML